MRKIWRSGIIYYWSWIFSRSCQHVGTGLQILNKCQLSVSGKMEVGNNFYVRSHKYNPVEISVSSGACLKIGDDTFLNQGVRIACSKEIYIGNNCLIGDECVILDTDYHAAPNGIVKTAPVIIEDNVWLATRVIVIRGVTIGHGSIIGAGSVITKSIPPNTFAAGQPVRIIKSLV